LVFFYLSPASLDPAEIADNKIASAILSFKPDDRSIRLDTAAFIADCVHKSDRFRRARVMAV
jgi:hypothetical protein